MSNQLTHEQIANVYHTVRDATEGTELKLDGVVMTPTERKLAIKLCRELTLEDFEEALTSGEIPAIELSEEEMQILSGGGRKTDFVLGFIHGILH